MLHGTSLCWLVNFHYFSKRHLTKSIGTGAPPALGMDTIVTEAIEVFLAAYVP